MAPIPDSKRHPNGLAYGIAKFFFDLKSGPEIDRAFGNVNSPWRSPEYVRLPHAAPRGRQFPAIAAAVPGLGTGDMRLFRMRDGIVGAGSSPSIGTTSLPVRSEEGSTSTIRGEIGKPFH